MPFQSTSTVPSTIPFTDVQTARDLWSQGRHAEAWNTLAQAGDRYADNASGVLGRNQDAADRTYELMVRHHWENTVGINAYNQEFNNLAHDHLSNYLDILERGFMPVTQDIINSYELSAVDNGLSKDVAFDGVWASATNILFDSLDNAWAGFLGMDLSRITTSNPTNGLTEQQAFELIKKAFEQTLIDLKQQGLVEEALGDFIDRGQEGTWDYFTDSLEGILDFLISPAYGKGIDPAIQQVIDLFKDSEVTQPPPTSSPLILDLDGDGVETVNIQDGVYFDHRGDGLAERSGWASSDDGLLVWDRNGDGLINDGGELFGDSTRLMNGSLATDGFQALAEYDENSDGKIDSADAIWNDLQIWQDTIRDGNTVAGELHALSDFNIRSISTTTMTPGTQDAAGNIETMLGSFERTDGSTGQIADYNLLAENTDTIADTRVEITSGIAALPGARGYGRTYDLHQAMARDTSGTLVTMVQNYVAESDPAARDVILEQIIFKWAGVEGVDPGSRGTFFDARKLGALETFLGEDFVGVSFPNTNPNVDAALVLDQAYENLFELVNAQLLAQTHVKPFYDKISFVWDESAQSLMVDLGPVIVEIQAQYTADPVVGGVMLGQFGRMVQGSGIEAALDYSRFRFAIAELGVDVLCTKGTGVELFMPLELRRMECHAGHA